MPLTKQYHYRWTNRPDGMNGNFYKLNGWSRRRLVWEFLRRSKRYQRACNEVFNSLRGEIDDVSPAEFGYRIPLKSLIDYTIDWEEAKGSFEIVTRTSVLSQGERAGAGNSDGSSILTFRIDLESVLTNRSILNLRIQQIAHECEKRLNEFAEHRQQRQLRCRFRAEPIGRSLRYLDLRTAGLASGEIASLLYGPNRSTEYKSRMLDKDRKRARNMLKGGLRNLMVSVLLDPKAVLADSKVSVDAPELE